MKNWLFGAVALTVFVVIGGSSYLMRKPAEYASAELGKAVLVRAISGISKASDGNTPLELKCSRKDEPVGSEPVVVECSGTGSKGPFTATFSAATRLPEFSLAGQGSSVGLMVTKFDGVPKIVEAPLVHAFEDVFAAAPQITN